MYVKCSLININYGQNHTPQQFNGYILQYFSHTSGSNNQRKKEEYVCHRWLGDIRLCCGQWQSLKTYFQVLACLEHYRFDIRMPYINSLLLLSYNGNIVCKIFWDRFSHYLIFRKVYNNFEYQLAQIQFSDTLWSPRATQPSTPPRYRPVWLG